MAVATGTALLTAAIIGGVATGVGMSQAQSARKKAKGQAEQAARIRADELKRSEALIARGEGLETEAAAAAEAKAKAKMGAIVAGKARRRATLATGPRGLLEEPEVRKPGLLGR